MCCTHEAFQRPPFGKIAKNNEFPEAKLSGSTNVHLISLIFINIYIYILTWNPNDPCFDWNVGLVLDWSRLKIEDKQVPGQYYSMYIYIFTYRLYIYIYPYAPRQNFAGQKILDVFFISHFHLDHLKMKFFRACLA